MHVKRGFVFVIVAVVFAAAGIAGAQATSTLEVKRGTVVSVWGNDLVVKMSDGTTKHVEVPEDFEFSVDGKMLPVSALKPGMNLTAVIKTRSVPIEVKTTEVKKGIVMAASGRTVIIRSAEGTKKYTVPGDFPFWVDGEQKTVYDLKEGMNVTAHIVHSHVEIVTDRDVQVAAKEAFKPKPAAAPKPAAKPAAVAAPALPKTGSSVPLAGLLGLLALAVSAGVALYRRF